MSYLNTIKAIRRAVKSAISATGRCKPTELAWNILDIARRGDVYVEDIKAAFDMLPTPKENSRPLPRQVEWKSVETALRYGHNGSKRPDYVFVLNKDKSLDI